LDLAAEEQGIYIVEEHIGCVAEICRINRDIPA
jgi:hypothetical protein